VGQTALLKKEIRDAEYKPMFAIAQIATTSTALSVPPSVLAVTASDQVSTRLTSTGISAPLPHTQLNNDTRNAPPVIPPAANSNETPANTGSQGANGPSAQFLAQALSQNNEDQTDNQIAVATSFAHFAPAPSYNTFIGYSLVRFRPSDAGIPSPYASSSPVTEDTQGPQAPTDYQAYSVTQTRNQSNLSGSLPQFVVAG
jgi:hypothetical protein